MSIPFGASADPGQQVPPQAQVEVGDVDFEDEAGKSRSSFPDGTTGSFNDYIVNNRFEKDSHRYMAGITSPDGFQGNSVAFFQLASPTLLWIADWTACRFGNPPIVPDTTPRDSNWILLDDHWEPGMISLGPDGTTPIYRISGTYVYGHKRPNARTHRNVTFSMAPWVDPAAGFTTNVPDITLTQGIINPGASTTLSPPGIVRPT